MYVGIRPEGYILNPDGAMHCVLNGVEVMGRDISVVSSHPACHAVAIRSIISSENKVDTSVSKVSFDLKPSKVLVFDKSTEKRIYLENI